jgi:hypothetical protein
LLAKAIQDWLNKEGDAINENGEEILDAHLFANKLGIPPQTFYKYICTESGHAMVGKNSPFYYHCDCRRIGTGQVARDRQWYLFTKILCSPTEEPVSGD